ncbi:hypothetical protein ABVN23_12715 [Pseudomonas fluorescens]|uniref:hypothetical protein n=1 Tax=Pseudomonas fluorescens TaxID=294 RepID=UPI003F9E9C2F
MLSPEDGQFRRTARHDRECHHPSSSMPGGQFGSGGVAADDLVRISAGTLAQLEDFVTMEGNERVVLLMTLLHHPQHVKVQ